MPVSEQEQQRLRTLEELGLLEPGNVPIFEEATQTAAHFLEATICFLGLMDRDRLWLRSAVGLSRIGLMNELASSRQLPRQDCFCNHIVNQQTLLIVDAEMDSALSNSVLVQRYGIRSFLGVPLVSSNGQYLGTLAVVGLTPRNFTHKEAEVLQLIARWSISEFERDRVAKQACFGSVQHGGAQHRGSQHGRVESLNSSPESSPVLPIKSRLIVQMTQELCTPLTSVLGMARVLSQGIYGALTDKQKEYIEIIHNSGQYLSSLVNEVMELGSLDDNPELSLQPIDVEMLCQQALSTLKQAAQRHSQQIQVTIEPGPRIWLLDKDKVRQMLYHLVFSVMQSSNPESIVRIHISRRQSFLNLAIWTSHPWLGEGLSQAEFTPQPPVNWFAVATLMNQEKQITRMDLKSDRTDGYAHLLEPQKTPDSPQLEGENSRYGLGLLLSRHLAELHGGDITVQGSQEEGYRYVIKLPQLRNKTEHN
jgi:hypothetical protein